MKTKETYQKTADTFKKKGDREWAKAKSGGGGHHYDNAKQNYDTAKKSPTKGGQYEVSNL